MKRAETAIQRHLVRWLRERYPHVGVVATLNENNRHCMDMGCEVGITDLILRWGKDEDNVEHIFYLELKVKKGKLNPDQIEWANNWRRRSNTYYAVAYGFSDAKRICEDMFN